MFTIDSIEARQIACGFVHLNDVRSLECIFQEGEGLIPISTYLTDVNFVEGIQFSKGKVITLLVAINARISHCLAEIATTNFRMETYLGQIALRNRMENYLLG